MCHRDLSVSVSTLTAVNKLRVQRSSTPAHTFTWHRYPHHTGSSVTSRLRQPHGLTPAIATGLHGAYARGKSCART